MAEGTYFPTAGTARDTGFSMLPGVGIYGGFEGVEARFSQRALLNSTSTLSGDIGTVGDTTDNSYHVVLNDGNGLDSTAVLDGFTITGGNADGTGSHNKGGGLYNGSSSPLVVNCHVTGNRAVEGGGMYNGGSSPKVFNSIFTHNVANEGAAVLNLDSAAPNIVNCTFYANTSDTSGLSRGTILDSLDASSTVTNCILWGNDSGEDEIVESDVAPSVNYSIVEGGHDGTGNINGDPKFEGPDDLRPSSCGSPAVDAGDNTANPLAVDYAGNTRIFESYSTLTIDIGAYELQEDLLAPIVWTGNGDGSLWSDGGNWNEGVVPGPCRDVLIPTGFHVIVPAAYGAVGVTLEVEEGAVLEFEPTAEMDIGN